MDDGSSPPVRFTDRAGHLTDEAIMLYVTCYMSGGVATTKRYPSIIAHLRTCDICRQEVVELQADTDNYLNVIPRPAQVPHTSVRSVIGIPSDPEPWKRLGGGAWLLELSRTLLDVFKSAAYVGAMRGNLLYTGTFITPDDISEKHESLELQLEVRLEDTKATTLMLVLSIERRRDASTINSTLAQPALHVTVTWDGGQFQANTDALGDVRIHGIPALALDALTIRLE